MAKKANQPLLNQDQLEAVTFGKGPLLIIAGAGTGKTTVITERIKWLITEKQIQPAEILALTFTDKAAREMESRIDMALPYGYTQMWITTFHSFGDRILRQEGIHIGLDPGYRLMTEAETVMFFRRHLFDFDITYFRPLGNPTKFIGGMLSHFSRLKDEDITPEEYLKWADNFTGDGEEDILNREKYIELAKAFRTYEELKAKNGLMDFSDLISKTLTLFRSRPNILKEYNSKFKFILIDEFQDTNFAQNELAVLLAGREKNITVVGDDDQAIYRWRGAAISNIIQFRKRFPEAKLIVLKTNYRSTSEILDRSYLLIQNNNPDRLEVKEKIDKRLKSARKLKGEDTELIFTERVEDEAEQVVQKIRELKQKNKNGDSLKWSDFAILVRANTHADPFSRALERAGIPYQFLGPGALFKQPEIKDLICYLKLLNNLGDSVALYRILTMDIFHITARDLTAILNFSRKVGLTLFESVEVIVAYHTNDNSHWSQTKNYRSYLPFISPVTKETLVKFISMVNKHLALAKKETGGQILYYFLEDTGLLKRLTAYETVKEERQALNISKFFDRMKSFETDHEEASISAIVDWIEMCMELGESPLAVDTDWVDNDAVNILTVHSSKGLEFPVVFAVNLVTNRFPTNERHEMIPVPDDLVKEILPEGDYHLEEERRLFYVAVTRARDKVYLTASKYYGEGKRERKISPFVYETLGKDSVLNIQSVESTVKQLTLLEWKRSELPEEKKIRIPVEYLSYSQIDTFTTCPLQYRLRYILKIPVQPNAAGSFGSSMHLALQKFYERSGQGENLTKDDLISLLDKVWLPVGYGSKEYEEKMKQRGYVMLSAYFEKIFDPRAKPLSLEQVFKIKISPTLKIGGKIDRIDQLDGNKIEIIDYKTGKRPPDKEIAENLQMTVYALAATDEGIYHKKPDEVVLSFYFLEKQEKVTSARTSEQLASAKKLLIDTAEKIATSSFEPKVGRWCEFCDFKLVCPAYK